MIHSQNLREDKQGNPIGSIFWYGRVWWNRLRCEWAFGRKASGFEISFSVGGGDSDDEFMVHMCLPFLFSIYLSLAGMYRCKEAKCGVAIHNGSIWFYPLSYRMDSPKSSDPWWRHHYSWYFPWSLDWYSTEILDSFRNRVWIETKKDRKGKDVFDQMRVRETFENKVSLIVTYTYTLRDGTHQVVDAKFHVTRMEHRAKWWPIIPIRKVSTSIWINFSGEIGEGTGSWKGGTLGCGYTLLDNEAPIECLRRMESERKFDR
jgi:hypothetical protein